MPRFWLLRKIWCDCYKPRIWSPLSLFPFQDPVVGWCFWETKFSTLASSWSSTLALASEREVPILSCHFGRRPHWRTIWSPISTPSNLCSQSFYTGEDSTKIRVFEIEAVRYFDFHQQVSPCHLREGWFHRCLPHSMLLQWFHGTPWKLPCCCKTSIFCFWEILARAWPGWKMQM